MKTALVLACVFAAAVPWSLLNILLCLIFLAAAFALNRGDAWGGYGAALFLAAQWLGALAAMSRFGLQDKSSADVAGGTVLLGAVVYLLFRAARGSSATGPSKYRWAWIALSAAVFLTPQIVRAYVIPNGSMEETILIGDQLLVRVLGISPSRGSLLVFRYPADTRETFVKRCMGMPGDRIKLVNKELYLNGRKLDEPYARHKTEYTDPYRDNFPSEPNVPLFGAGQEMLDRHVVKGEVVVPPDSYFVIQSGFLP